MLIESLQRNLLTKRLVYGILYTVDEGHARGCAACPPPTYERGLFAMSNYKIYQSLAVLSDKSLRAVMNGCHAYTGQLTFRRDDHRPMADAVRYALWHLNGRSAYKRDHAEIRINRHHRRRGSDNLPIVPNTLCGWKHPMDNRFGG